MKHIDSDDQSPATLSAEWRENWATLAASTTGYGTGIGMFFMTASQFLLPMRASLGWSITQLTVGPIVGLIIAFCQPISGRLTSALGAKRVACTGATLLSLAYLIPAVTAPSLAIYYGFAALLGVIGPLTSTVPYSRALAPYFNRNLGAALGVAFSGASLISFIAMPIVSIAISESWRMGYVALAMLTSFIGIPAVFFGLNQTKGGSKFRRADIERGAIGATVLGTPFWMLALSLLIAGIPLGGFMMHITPILLERKLEPSTATGLAVSYALSIAIGRILGGVLLDRLHDGAVALGLLSLSAVGAILLQSSAALQAYPVIGLAALLVGLGQGAEADFVAFFALRLFGSQNYPLIVSYLSLAAGIGFASGGMIFALIRDATGNYDAACLVGASSFCLAGFGIMCARYMGSPQVGS